MSVTVPGIASPCEPPHPANAAAPRSAAVPNTACLSLIICCLSVTARLDVTSLFGALRRHSRTLGHATGPSSELLPMFSATAYTHRGSDRAGNTAVREHEERKHDQTDDQVTVYELPDANAQAQDEQN